MRFLNSLRLLFENFKSVYKLLLYKIIITIVGLALCTAFILPELTAIFQSPEVQVFISDCKKLFEVITSLQGTELEAVKDSILGQTGSLQAALPPEGNIPPLPHFRTRTGIHRKHRHLFPR